MPRPSVFVRSNQAPSPETISGSPAGLPARRPLDATDSGVHGPEGFSLIELLVVVAILGILATLGANLIRSRDQALVIRIAGVWFAATKVRMRDAVDRIVESAGGSRPPRTPSSPAPPR